MMNKYVLGIDLGTSAVKVSCLDINGQIKFQTSAEYPIFNLKEGFSEQNPNDWVNATLKCIKNIVANLSENSFIEGISFSGQMHSLVILDKNYNVIRNAILWNDTRTDKESDYINKTMGKELIKITGNRATPGFTLPKLLWLKKYEPENFSKIAVFLMPKDYVRYKLTGNIAMDYSDATGTIMLNISKNSWSSKILNLFNIPKNICPNLINSEDFVGYPLKRICKITGLNPKTKIFAGAGDNAAAAIGAGILDDDKALCSIGTSGVILVGEKLPHMPYEGTLQMEHHSVADHFYSMGVTLSAGDSLSWFKKVFYKDIPFNKLIEKAEKSSIGADHLLFTPYINGERTPYSDAYIRGSFVGLSSTTTENDFCRSVLEGITFSLRDIIEIYRNSKRQIKEVISIGGGAKSNFWLHLQANIFNKPIISLKNEQGPGIGAAMIAAMGCNWFTDWEDCVSSFVSYDQIIKPNETDAKIYSKIYQIYKKVYQATAPITKSLLEI